MTIKCKKDGVLTLDPKEFSPKQRKLFNRYNAISHLYHEVKDKDFLTDQDKTLGKQALQICLDNKPAWSERTFLKKLIDVFLGALSIGLKPLYHTYFSKEKQLKTKIINSLSGPKI